MVKLFAIDSSANIKISRTQLHKIRQSRGFLGRLLGSLLKTGLPLIGHLLKPFAKSVLMSLGLTTPASATNAAIYKKMFGLGISTLIILHEEMNDIIKITNSLEESGLLIKGISETIKYKAKEQKGGFLGMLLDTFITSLLGNLLTSKCIEDFGAIYACKNHIKINCEYSAIKR